MKRKNILFSSAVLLFSLVLFACSSLLPPEEEVVAGEYGSPLTSQEHQVRTFEALWTNLQENYIYFESADVDWDSLHDQYTNRINSGLTNQEFVALLNELEADLPEGSILYQSRAERVENDSADTSTYGGIGAYIGFQPEPEPHIVILAVMKGSPAEKAGLKAHDSLYKIDGSPILLDEGLNAVQRVRGPAGTSVELIVKSPGEAERTVTVTRAQLTSTGQLEAYQVAGTNYGYILFPPIAYASLMDDVVNSLRAFTSNKTLDGLILDFRITGSSGTWPLEEMFTLFHNGKIGEFFNRTQSQPAQITGQDFFGSQKVPLVILVGENTSGFPEILAASLQAYDRATIIGDTTPGSIETTTAYFLPDGSRVFIQTTSFRIEGGGDLGNNGVQPDVRVEAGWDEVLPENDPVLDKAIEVLEAQQ
ncbi:MAG: PDZ domain-containing protein [Chloroflexi bacterium]|nr:PDZ domain-containing protein [Chloroflexota bacterium]